VTRAFAEEAEVIGQCAGAVEEYLA